LRLAEEGGSFLRVVAELMAEDAEETRGVAEAAGDVGRGLFIDEEGAESFILALQRELRRQEEVLVARCGYLICSAGIHNHIVLPKHEAVNMFGKARKPVSTESRQKRHQVHTVGVQARGRDLAGLIG
jgi:hypothetical protein